MKIFVALMEQQIIKARLINKLTEMVELLDLIIHLKSALCHITKRDYCHPVDVILNGVAICNFC